MVECSRQGKKDVKSNFVSMNQINRYRARGGSLHFPSHQALNSGLLASYLVFESKT